jgi:hypothetical protein
MKTYGWVEVSGQLHISAALFLGKEHQVPIGLEAGWAPELDAMAKREKKNPFLALAENQNPVVQLVA